MDFVIGSSQPGSGRTIMVGGTGTPRPVVAGNNASKYVIVTSRPTTPSQVSVGLLATFSRYDQKITGLNLKKNKLGYISVMSCYMLPDVKECAEPLWQQLTFFICRRSETQFFFEEGGGERSHRHLSL
jgi:hypothetical protein